MKHFMKRFKKPLSLVLAFCMFLSVIGTGLTVLAAEAVERQQTTSKAGVDSGTMADQTAGKEGTEFDIKMEEWGELDGSFAIPGMGDMDLSWQGKTISPDVAAINDAEMAKEMAKIINANYAFLNSTFANGESKFTESSKINGGDPYQKGRQEGFVLTDDANGTLNKLQRLYYNIGMKLVQTTMTKDAPSDIMANKVYEAIKPYLSQEVLSVVRNDPYVLNQASSGWHENGKRTFLSWMFAFFHGHQDFHRNTYLDGKASWSDNIGAQHYSIVAADTTGKKYLTQYKAIENIPEKIPTANFWTQQFKFIHPRWSGNWTTYFVWHSEVGINNVSVNDVTTVSWVQEIFNNVKNAGRITDPDTTSRTVLRDFQSLFTLELMRKDPAKLSLTELRDLLSRGGKIISGGEGYGNGIADMDASVGKHFFTVENGYSDDPFQQARDFYNAAIEAAVDKYNETVNDLYTQYNNIVGTLDIDTLESIKEELEGVEEIYTILNGAGKGQEVQDAKVKYDELYNKVLNALSLKYGEAYDKAILELVAAINAATVDEVKTEIDYVLASETKSHISGDTADGKIKNVADKYFDAAYYWVAKIGSEAGGATETPATLEGTIADRVKQNGVTDAAFADNILLAVSGTKDLADKNNAEVTVVNDPLWNTYNAINEIPAKYTVKTTLYKYMINSDGKIASKESIVKHDYEEENTTAKQDFESWKKLFTDGFLNQDLSTMLIDMLENNQYKAQSMLDKVQSKYSERVLNKYLQRPDTATVAEVEAFLAKFPPAFADAFIKETDTFIKQWEGETADSIKADKNKMEQFITYKDKLLGVYNSLTDELKARGDVADAYNRLTQAPFGDKVNAVQEEYDLQQYLKAAAKMYPYFGNITFNDVMNAQNADGFTCNIKADDLSLTYIIKDEIITRYNVLTEAAKGDQRVTKHQALYAKFDAKRIEVIQGPNSWYSEADTYYNTWKESIPYASNMADTAAESNANKLIGQLDGLMQSDFLKNLLNSILATAENPTPIGPTDNVNEWIYNSMIDLICSDATVNAILGLYPLLIGILGSNVGTIHNMTYNIVVTVDKVLQYAWGANDFVEARNVFVKHQNDGDVAAWNNAIAEKPHWIDEDLPTEEKVDTFIKAVAVALKGIQPVIGFLLTADQIESKVIVSFTGDHGLKQHIIPLLMNLGMDKYMSTSKATQWYNTVNHWNGSHSGGYNTFEYYGALLTPIFDWIKQVVLKNPVSLITDILPRLGYMFTRGHIRDGVLDLVSTLSNISIGSIQIVPMDQLTTPINDLLGDATSLDWLLKKFLPDLGGLELPILPMAQLSRLARENGVPYTQSIGGFNNGGGVYYYPKNLEASRADVLICLLRYAVDVLKTNRGLLDNLLASVDLGGLDLSSIIDTVMSKDNDVIINAIFGLLYPNEITDVDWNMEKLNEGGWKWTSSLDDLYGESGVDSDRAQEAIGNIDTLLKAVVKQLMASDLETLVADNVFSDANINTLIKTLYGAGGAASSIGALLGIDMSYSAFVQALSDSMAYEQNADIMANYTDWATFIADLDAGKVTLTWVIENKDSNITKSVSFAHALSVVLSPFNPLLETLLIGKDMPLVSDIIMVTGANGYKNAIIPLLSMLGCNNPKITELNGNVAIQTEEDYVRYATEQKNEPARLLFPILKPIMGLVDVALENPVMTIAEILPNIAFYLDNGGLSKAIYALLAPVTNLLEPIIPVITPDGEPQKTNVIEALVDLIAPTLEEDLGITIQWDNPEASLIQIINKMFLKDININGQSLSIQLPEEVWSKFAGIGKAESDGGIFFDDNIIDMPGDPSTYHIEADAGGVAFAVLTYVFDIVKQNTDAIEKLAGTNIMSMFFVGDLIRNLSAVDSKLAAGALIKLLTLKEKEFEASDFVGALSEFNDQLAEFSGEEISDVTLAIRNLDKIVAYALPTLLNKPGATIDSLVKENLYTDNIVSMLFDLVYTNGIATLDATTSNAIFGLIGADVTPKGLAAQLEAFPAVAEQLNKDTWAEVKIDWATVKWGVDGDAQKFAGAISAMLAPFAKIIKSLLAGDDIVIYEGFTLPGNIGYVNAIVPVFGALGMTSEDLDFSKYDTKEELMAIDDKNIVSELILTPVLNYVDRIGDKPVESLVTLLPNLAYFLKSKGLTTAIENLLSPIINAATPLIVFLPDKVQQDVGNIDLSGSKSNLMVYVKALLNGVDFASLGVSGEIAGVLNGVDFSDIENTLLTALKDFLEGGFEINGKTYKFNFKRADGTNILDNLWGTIASFGEKKDNGDAPFFAGNINNPDNGKSYIKSNPNNAFVGILNLVFEIVTLNVDVIKSLVGEDMMNTFFLGDLINNLANVKPVDATKALIKLLTLKDVDASDFNLEDFNVEFSNELAGLESQGVQRADVAKAIENLDKIIAYALPTLLNKPGATVGTLVAENLYTDSIVSMLFDLIYTNGIAKLDAATANTIFGLIGIDVSPKALAAHLAGFSEVAAQLNKETWADVSIDWNTVKWNIAGSGDNFANAISAMLAPFADIIKVLLTGNDLVIADGFTLPGNVGYTNAIVPVFGALGMTNADLVVSATATPEELQAIDAKDVVSKLLLQPIVNYVDRIAENPVESIISLLPNLAFFMNANGLTTAVENLLSPIVNAATPLMAFLPQEVAGEVMSNESIPAYVKSLLNGVDFASLGVSVEIAGVLNEIRFDDLENSLLTALNNYLAKGIEISGKKYVFNFVNKEGENVITNLWSDVASFGQMQTNGDAPFFAGTAGGDKKYVAADIENTFVGVLNTVFEVVSLNVDVIKQLAGDEIMNTFFLGDLINNLANVKAEEATAALIKLLSLKEVTPDNYDDIVIEYNDQLAGMALQGVERTDVAKAIENLDKIIAYALPTLLNKPGATVGTLVAENLYTDSIVSMLFDLIYTNGIAKLDAATANTIFGLIGVDASPKALAAHLAGFPEVAAQLDKETWAEVSIDWTAVKWNIAGSGDNFANAISAMLAPFADIIKVLLTGNDLVIADGFTLPGNVGYTNAIVPVFGALGMTNSDLVVPATTSKEDLQAINAKDVVSKLLIQPIVNYVDRISERPVASVVSLLPNLAAFMNSNSLTKAVENLLSPITNAATPLIAFLPDNVAGAVMNDDSIPDYVKSLLNGVDFASLGISVEIAGVLNEIRFDDLENSLLTALNNYLAKGIEISGKKYVFNFVNKEGENVITNLWSDVASFGQMQTNGDAPFFAGTAGGDKKYVAADIENTFVGVLNTVFEVVSLNVDVIKELVGEDMMNTFFLGDLINNLANVKAEEATAALIKLLTLKEVTPSNYKQVIIEFNNELEKLSPDVADNVSTAIANLENLIKFILPKLLNKEGATIGGLVAENLYTDSIVAALFDLVYTNGIAKLDAATANTIFGLIGVDASPKALAADLAAFSEVAAQLDKDTWAEVSIDWNTVKWNIAGNGETFANAISAMLAPFAKIIKVLLTGDDLVIADGFTLTGHVGYTNAIIPLFGALGMTSADLAVPANATEDTLKSIDEKEVVSKLVLEPIVNYVDRISDAPVSALVSLVPNLAYFMQMNGLTTAVENLLAPIVNAATPLIAFLPENVAGEVINNESIPAYVKSLLTGMDFTSLGLTGDAASILNEIDFNDIENSLLKVVSDYLKKGIVIDGETYVINFVNADGVNVIEGLWARLASLGEVQTNGDAPFFQGTGTGTGDNYYIKANVDNTFVGVLNTVFEVLLLNQDLANKLIDKYLPADSMDASVRNVIMMLVNKLFTVNEPKDFTELLIRVLSDDFGDVEDDTWDMSKFEHAVFDAVYDEDVNDEMILKAVTNLNAIVEMLLPQLLNGKTLKETVDGALYAESSETALSIPTTLFKAIYGLFTDQSMIDTISTLGLNVTVAGVAENLKDYPEIKAILDGKATWTDVVNDPALATAKWGIKDAQTFAAAIADIFAPFNPVLKALLVDEDYVINIEGQKVITIKGANGYSNSVIPLLGALGCSPVDASEYKELVEQDETNLIAQIIVPVLGLVDKVCDDPINTLIDILPNLAYFLDNGGLTRVVTNLLLPIENIAEDILPLVGAEEDESVIDFVLRFVEESGLVELPSWLVIRDADGNLSLESAVNPALKYFLEQGFDIEGVGHISLKAPSIDFGEIAGCGEKKATDNPFVMFFEGDSADKYYVESNHAKMAWYLFEFIAKTVLDNKATITELVAGLITDIDANLQALIVQLLDNVFAKDSKALAGAIVKLLAFNKPGSFDWQYASWVMTEMTYPEGITGAEVNQALYVVDKLIENALNLSIIKNIDALKNIGLGDEGLTGVINANLYTDANVAAIAGAIYPMLEDLLAGENGATIQSILDIAGIKLTPAAVGAYWTEFEGAENLAGLTSFKGFDFTSIKWNANSKEGFASALAAVFAPFNPVLEVLLTGDSIKYEDLEISGGMGYRNSIMHILVALGCTAEDGLLTPDEYEAKYANRENAEGILYDIILPVLSLVERIAKAPVQTLATILPNLAYFMNSNGLVQAIEGLVHPVVGLVQPILDMVKPEGQSNVGFLVDVLKGLGINLAINGIELDVDNIKDQLIPIVNSFLKDIDLGNGTKLSLQLPNIDWAKAAGFGTELKDTPYGKVVTPDTAKVTYGVLEYVAKTLSMNAAQIKALVGGMVDSEIVDQIVNNVTSLTGGELLSVIVNLLVPDDSGLDGDWSFKKITEQGIEYTPNLGKDNYIAAVDMLDGMLPGLIGQFAGGGDLQSLVGGMLFTPDMMTTIATSIFGLLNSETLTPDILTLIKEALGVDLSPYGFAKEIRSNEKQFASLRTALLKAENWEDVDWSKVDWGFQTGDQDGFVKAIAVLLRPLNGVLGAVLNGKDLYVLDELVIKGGDGYNNAIIPLLETFGCKDILTAAEYAKAIEKDPDNTIIAIVKPLLNAVNDILAKPIDGLTALLPNLGCFIYNDGISQLIDNLILPVTKVLDAVAPIYDLDIDSLIAPIADPAGLVGTLNNLLGGIKIGDKALNVKLDAGMFEKLASLGKPVTKESKRVDAYSNATTMTYIEANKGDVLLTVLRFVVDTLKDNLDTIKGLLDGVDLGSLGGVVTDLFGQIDAMTTDEVIEMLLGMLGIGSVEDDYDDDDFTDDEYLEEETSEEETSEEEIPSEETPSEEAPSDDGQTEQGPEKGVNLPLIIGLSVGGLLLLAGLIFLIIFLKKRKKKEEDK